jgi:3-hydroxyacyl-[acyl-carrier-protein] dehydratase
MTDEDTAKRQQSPKGTATPPHGTPTLPATDKLAQKLPMQWADITAVLPHRFPFLLVDRVVAIEPGKKVKAYKNVSANEAFFQGHFPGLPVMPGVLQLEALAQAAAVLASTFPDFDQKTHVAYLMSMDEVKFRRIVVPGDRLDLDVEVVQQRKGIAKVKGQATVDGERAAEAIITAAIRPRA